MQPKPHHLPHVWKRLWSLPVGTDFSLDRYDYEIFFKAGAFLAHSASRRRSIFVAPWRKVRTTQLLRDALSADLPAQLEKRFLKEAVNREVNSPPFIAKFESGVFPGRDEVRKPYTAEQLRRNIDAAHRDDNRTGPSA